MLAQGKANAQMSWGLSTAVVDSPTGNYTATPAPSSGFYSATVLLSGTMSAVGTGTPSTTYLVTLYMNLSNYAWSYPKGQTPPANPSLTLLSNKTGANANSYSATTDANGTWKDPFFQNVTVSESKSLKGYNDNMERVMNMYRTVAYISVNYGDVKAAYKDYRVTY